MKRSIEIESTGGMETYIIRPENAGGVMHHAAGEMSSRIRIAIRCNT